MTFILLGSEEGMKNAFIKEIKKEVFKKHKDAEEYVLYSSDGDAHPPFIDALLSSSLFSEYKILILKEGEAIKKDSPLFKALNEYAENGDDASSTLIFTSSSASKYVIPPALLKKVGEEKVKIFWEMTEGQKRAWITKRVEELGFYIDKDAIEEILSLVDNTTLEMNALLEPLTSFLRGKKTEITKEDVESYTSRTRGENGYTLFSSISKCDLERSLLISSSILSQDSTSVVPVISVLSSSFRRLEECLRLKKKGVALPTIFSSCSPVSLLSTKKDDKDKKKGGINFKEQDTFKIGMDNYTLEDVKRIIIYLGEEDILLRSTSLDLLPLRMEEMIYTIIENKGKVSQTSLYNEDLLSSPLNNYS